MAQGGTEGAAENKEMNHREIMADLPDAEKVEYLASILDGLLHPDSEAITRFGLSGDQLAVFSLLRRYPGKVSTPSGILEAIDPNANHSEWAVASIIKRIRKRLLGSEYRIKCASGIGFYMEIGLDDERAN